MARPPGPEGPTPVRVGDVLAGKYQVERVLGAGGMGVVVCAVHLDLQERRAIKFMLPAARADEQLVKRFLREARAAVQLKSEHVAQVHDVGRFDSGEPYMVMEYLEGTDLKQLLKERGPLPVAEAVGYVLQALEAVVLAHGLGIIHRDLKPANLFLARGTGGRPCVKVLDFGISKLTQELAAGEGFDMTATASMLGSPCYMSPEQMRSARDVDVTSDLWSFGVILYELVTGRLPFAGESIAQICTSVLQDEPAPIYQHRPELPASLDAVIRRCLAKDLDRRFPTAASLAEALWPFGDASAARALPDGLGRGTGEGHAAPAAGALAPPCPPAASGGVEPLPTGSTVAAAPLLYASGHTVAAWPGAPPPSSAASWSGTPAGAAAAVPPLAQATGGTNASWCGTSAPTPTVRSPRRALVITLGALAAVSLAALALWRGPSWSPAGDGSPEATVPERTLPVGERPTTAAPSRTAETPEASASSAGSISPSASASVSASARRSDDRPPVPRSSATPKGDAFGDRYNRD